MIVFFNNGSQSVSYSVTQSVSDKGTYRAIGTAKNHLEGQSVQSIMVEVHLSLVTSFHIMHYNCIYTKFIQNWAKNLSCINDNLEKS